jgi:hypothetical protein
MQLEKSIPFGRYYIIQLKKPRYDNWKIPVGILV